ncbi:hypothetical protein COU74_02045 [Candidatus Peregrinibacteria bacterium CG10_big_fil_rev_8_21_14_0_10_36_19]|nr:MAG: hypothetical protein COU74_02045 [Candidatus Peregrinibacteria bacterium CG10_big_fil_rev_8_21_14_0_10_36_19]
MHKLLKKWLSVATIVSALLPNVLTANAFTIVEGLQSKPLEITENSYKDGWINFCLNGDAKVTLGVYKATTATKSDTLEMLANNKVYPKGCYKEKWLGTAQSNYFYGISAEATTFWYTGTPYVSEWLMASETANTLKIWDAYVDNATFSPWDEEKAKINFNTSQKSDVTVEIYNQNNKRQVTLKSAYTYQSGDHTVYWDGKNQYGNIVEEGEYTYEISASNSNGNAYKSGKIYVKDDLSADTSTEDPRLKYVFASKETFDPGRKEKTYITFNLTADADVTVTIYKKNGTKFDEIFNENDLNEGTYSVAWDGYGTDMSESYYTYKVHASNSKGESTESGKIYVKQDDAANKRPNVFKDSVSKIPFYPKNGSLDFTFTVDRDSKVTLEIKDGSYTEATVLEDYSVQEGTHSFSWNGVNRYGEYSTDGVYGYKITAENSKGKDVEEGKFYIADSTKAQNIYGSCSTFTDVDKSNKYCDAIKWAKSANIFSGYSDGSFKPNQSIQRVEALKVILETFNIKSSDTYGSNYFKDTDGYQWYAPYLKTAVNLGIVNGYSDGTFRPANSVNRIEALVMILNTGKTKGLIVPSNANSYPYYDVPGNSDSKWYLNYAWLAKTYELTDNQNYFYPGQSITRAEMADMLYRYYKAGLER